MLKLSGVETVNPVNKFANSTIRSQTTVVLNPITFFPLVEVWGFNLCAVILGGEIDEQFKSTSWGTPIGEYCLN